MYRKLNLYQKIKKSFEQNITKEKKLGTNILSVKKFRYQNKVQP